MIFAYQPDTSALGGSLLATALVSMLPLATVFVLLGLLRVKAHLAGLAGLAVAMVVAVAAFGMPVGDALLSASEGAVFGLLPIMWIVLTAIWLYQITVLSGRFEDLRTAFNLISDDPRIQAIIVAFCFGGLLEALAGFGAPVAITGVMLVALGFPAIRAATVVLLANTAPVAFGAIAIPILTAGTLTGIDYNEIGAIVGRQTPLLASLVPLLLVFLVDGRRGIRQIWPAALVTGAAFGVAQFVSSNFLSVELTDIIASLVALAALVAFLRIWAPTGSQDARADLIALATAGPEPSGGIPPLGGKVATATTNSATTTNGQTSGTRQTMATATLPAPTSLPVTTLSPARRAMAFLPYILVIVVFSVAKLAAPVKQFLVGTGVKGDIGTDIKIHWPGIDGAVLNLAGKPAAATVYTLSWLSSPGTLLLFSGVIIALIYKVRPVDATKEFGATVYKMRFAILTVASVLALAFVMNLSGQTITIGQWLAAGTGGLFAFLSPILGWLGTAVTGSDTSSNALFATLQQSAATKAGIDPTLLVAANTSGGVLGKMISPQNLTIAATAVGLAGKESDIFRAVAKWSFGLLLGLCLLVYLQSTVLSWMLP
jgi:lactate permease